MKPVRLALILMLLVLTCAGLAHADSVRWERLRTDHFTILYAPGHRKTADRAGAIAERWFHILSRKLQVTPHRIVPIYIHPNRRTFAADTGVKPQDPLVGLAHFRTLEITIDGTEVFEGMARVIPHELVHIFVYMKLHGAVDDLPLWMHEGLAKYLADDWSGADAELLADAASSGQLLPLTEITDSFPSDRRMVSVAYVQSYSAVKFMVDKYRDSSIPDLLTELARERSFEKAMQYSIGITFDRFQKEWQQHVWEEHNLGRWLKLGAGLISFSMAFFAILAYRRRQILKQHKVEQFEQEEDDEEWPDERGNRIPQ